MACEPHTCSSALNCQHWITAVTNTPFAPVVTSVSALRSSDVHTGRWNHAKRRTCSDRHRSAVADRRVITAGSGLRLVQGEGRRHAQPHRDPLVTSVRSLVALNKLPGNGNAIYAGEVLKVPGKGGTPASGRPSAHGSAGSPTSSSRVTPSPRSPSGTSARQATCSPPTDCAPATTSTPANRCRSRSRSARRPRRRSRRRTTASPAARTPTTSSPRANRNRADPEEAASCRPARQMRALITTTAKRCGVDPELALAVSWREAGWKQRVVSPANAIGAMQVIPSTGSSPPASSGGTWICSGRRTTSPPEWCCWTG